MCIYCGAFLQKYLKRHHLYLDKGYKVHLLKHCSIDVWGCTSSFDVSNVSNPLFDLRSKSLWLALWKLASSNMQGMLAMRGYSTHRNRYTPTSQHCARMCPYWFSSVSNSKLIFRGASAMCHSKRSLFTADKLPILDKFRRHVGDASSRRRRLPSLWFRMRLVF